MTSPSLNWEVCRSFLAVLREGNLSRAARALRLTQPTIGRHIDEIERALGVSLFMRSPQGLSPTDAAFDLRPHVEAMAAAADALVRAASGSAESVQGTVRITAPELFGVEVLPAILAEFHNRHPGIVIELASAKPSPASKSLRNSVRIDCVSDRLPLARRTNTRSPGWANVCIFRVVLI